MAVAPRIQETLSLTNTQVGSVMSAFMVGYFLMSPIFGWASDRYSRKWLMAGGIFLWCLATLGSGFVTTFSGLILMRVLVGVGEASYIASSPTILTDLFPEGKRNQVVAWYQAAVPIGAALGFVAGGFLEHHFGWRWAFYVAGIPGFLAIVALLFIKEPRRGAAEKPHVQLQTAPAHSSILKTTIREFLTNPIYRTAVFGYTAYSFTLGGFASWCPKYSVAVRGMALSDANYVIGAITVVAGVGGTVLGGWTAARAFLRFGKKGPVWVMVGSAFLATIPAFYSFLSGSKEGFFWGLGVAQFLLFLGHTPVNVVIVEAVPYYIRATALALTTFVIHILGDLISPPLVGWLADHYSLESGILVLPAMLIVCGIFWVRTLVAVQTSKPQ